MIVAVTGGTGFIGKRLVGELLAAGHDVRVLTRRAAPESGPNERVRYVQGDLAHDLDAPAFLDGVSVLYHCAGEISDPARMHDLHVLGTRRLVTAARGRIGHWVQLSSTGAYGPRRTGLVLEDEPLKPVGAYETTKVESDRHVAEAAGDGAFSHTVLRPSIVFGAGMPNQSLFSLMRMIEKRLFFFIGSPGASANYIHVDNVVAALLACGQDSRAHGQVFNLSDHCTVEMFTGLLATALGVGPPTLRLPEAPVRILARALEALPGWPLKLSRIDALTSFVRYPSTKIESLLHYRRKLSMAEGIAELVHFYRSRPS